MALVSEFEGFIFDYGGVLVHHQTDEDRAKMASIAGLPEEQFTELYWSERDAYDRDLVTGTEYWQSIGSAGGAKLSEDQILALVERDTTSWMQYDPVMWEWVAALSSAGKKVAMLSNMPRDLGEALKSRTERLSVFDHVTLSYDLRAVKPDPIIYEECLEGIGTAKERTLFLDDRIENIQGAETLGIRSIQFTSRDEVLLRIRG